MRFESDTPGLFGHQKERRRVYPGSSGRPRITVTLHSATGTAGWAQLWNWLLSDEPRQNESADDVEARRRSESTSGEEEGHAHGKG